MQKLVSSGLKPLGGSKLKPIPSQDSPKSARRGTASASDASGLADYFRHHNTLVYGLPKSGKSTLLDSLGAIVWATERGWNAIGADKVNYVDPKEVKKPLVFGDLGIDSGDIVALDTVDELHRMCVTSACKSLHIETIGDAQWNKGRDLKNKIFADYLAPFLKHEGGSILVCHAREVTVKNREVLRPNALDKAATFALEAAADTIAFLDIDDRKLWFHHCPFASAASRFANDLPSYVDLEN